MLYAYTCMLLSFEPKKKEKKKTNSINIIQEVLSCGSICCFFLYSDR